MKEVGNSGPNCAWKHNKLAEGAGKAALYKLRLLHCLAQCIYMYIHCTYMYICTCIIPSVLKSGVPA